MSVDVMVYGAFALQGAVSTALAIYATVIARRARRSALRANERVSQYISAHAQVDERKAADIIRSGALQRAGQPHLWPVPQV